MNELILVVDDEIEIVKLARDYLEQASFRVLNAKDGLTALATARRERRTLRRESDVPIIMLTARVEEADRLIGLELGADDYITKPFSPRELVARVRSVLRRTQGEIHQPEIIRAADLEIHLGGHRVTRAGDPVNLSRIEFNLLVIFARHPGLTYTRAQLLERIHGYAFEGYDRSIDAHVKNLRRKLEREPAEPQYILTVYGVGYKFNDEL
jgi:two-component system alkaline phosphatase synthesis response regulator PhoP